MEAAEKKCVSSADAGEAVENKGEAEGIKRIETKEPIFGVG